MPRLGPIHRVLPNVGQSLSFPQKLLCNYNTVTLSLSQPGSQSAQTGAPKMVAVTDVSRSDNNKNNSSRAESEANRGDVGSRTSILALRQATNIG